MNKYKRKRFFIVLLVLFVSIGFAALAASLYINGTALFKQPKVNVYFANPLVSSGSSSTDLPTITNKTTLNYSADLEPGDYYEFTVDVVNDSSLDTVIKSISISATDGTNTIEVPSFLEVTYEYSDGNKIYRNQLLPGKSSKNIRVKVECLQQNEYEEFSGTLQFNIEYNFDDGTGVEVGRNEVCYNNINVEVPAGTVCKRAETLHYEVCANPYSSGACKGSGYASNDLIIYGNCGNREEEPKPGDAFDCDVDGNGTFDEDERFYYVSDAGSNEGYATLIYYKNIVTSAYKNTSPYNSEGPVTLLALLPSTTEWSNNALNTGMTRQILNENGVATSNSGSRTLPNYTYTDRAARLLTTQEVESACGIEVRNYKAGDKIGDLDNCQYLLENTKYATDSGTYYWWLETPASSNGFQIWRVDSMERSVSYYSSESTYGVRPAIEVDKTKIAY